MDDIHGRIEAFVRLGKFMSQFSQPTPEKTDDIAANDEFFERFDQAIEAAFHANSWFTRENVAHALKSWSSVLTEKELKSWMSSYLLEDSEPKKVALIMAGNIPLVGFHDLLCVLITGNTALIKPSSNDEKLLPVLLEYLQEVYPPFRKRIIIQKENLKDFDAVIATGSDNTARYFEYYFGSKPNIIRKNRNSVAVLDGSESAEQLEALGEDIFRYYGLGCRSVSKLFVPEGYDFDPLFQAVYKFRYLIEEDKYANNYDYNKAVYLMSLFSLTENGFLMLKEDESYASPIASVFYETYTDKNSLKEKIRQDADKIQCVVSNDFIEGEVAFGQTQQPGLKDYADGVDVVRFLLSV
ncbi:acyl-CoA reductase [Robertkochia aurantiaca]|uniref:acyl-CoA reductase n=1 Tax=Robertkochia aurantiaca TaxID=2873700 RepID=UPI001CCCB07D|nr:acyl-CoA reductase [Robertkochia sp. 3YJGBD-33]